MKVLLFLTLGLGYGGAEKNVFVIAEGLATLGYEVHICSIETASSIYNIDRKTCGAVEIHNIPCKGLKVLRRLIQYKKVKRLAKKINADAIIGFTVYPNLFASLIGSSLRIPSIMSERGDPFVTFCSSFISKVMIRIINRCDGGIFQTEQAKSFYGKKLQNKSAVIPNPIDIDGLNQINEKEVIDNSIISVSRFDNKQKRYDIMFDAFKIFSVKHPEYTLKLFGNGPDEDLLKRFVLERNMENKVLFMGVTNNPLSEMKKSKMFILTSDYEGIPNSLLEAMAVGIPVISTDCSPGGARMLISDHINGLLVPKRNVVEISKAMSEYAENDELRIKCGINAQKVLTRFNKDKILKCWCEYLNSVICHYPCC